MYFVRNLFKRVTQYNFTKKECDIINQACENRGDSIEVKASHRVYKEYWRAYTKSMILNKRVNTSNKVSLGLMSGSAVFCYDISLLFCCKTIQEHILKQQNHKGQRNILHTK